MTLPGRMVGIPRRHNIFCVCIAAMSFSMGRPLTPPTFSWARLAISWSDLFILPLLWMVLDSSELAKSPIVYFGTQT